MNIRPIITPVIQKAKYAAMATALVAGATALNSCKKEQNCITEYQYHNTYDPNNYTYVTPEGDTVIRPHMEVSTPTATTKCY